MLSMGKKIVEAAAAKLAPTGGLSSHRPDLYLADTQQIANDTSRVLIGWGTHSETPAVTAVENFVTGNFNGMVRIDHRTIRFYPESRVAEVVCSWTTPTASMDAAKKMARITPTRYLEAGSKAIWEVREDETGGKYLARLAEDNLDALLAEKRNQVKGGRTASFATLRREAGLLALHEGDTVRFYDHGVLKEGRVETLGAEIVILSGNDRVRVGENAISEIVTKDPKTVGDYRDRVMDYWKKVLPPEYISKWNAAGGAGK